MTNHEAIKKMKVDEMADVFLAFVKPFAGEMTAEEEAEFKEKIIAFLSKKVEE